MGLSHLTGAVRQMMKKITSVDQDNYPEMLGKTCIINAPGAFKMIWSGVQGMLEPRTRAKIEVGAAPTLRLMFSGHHRLSVDATNNDGGLVLLQAFSTSPIQKAQCLMRNVPSALRATRSLTSPCRLCAAAAGLTCLAQE